MRKLALFHVAHNIESGVVCSWVDCGVCCISLAESRQERDARFRSFRRRNAVAAKETRSPEGRPALLQPPPPPWSRRRTMKPLSWVVTHTSPDDIPRSLGKLG